MEGISRAEPVRFVPVVFRNGLRTYKGSITGLSPAPVLHRALDKDLRPIALPERGIVLSTPLADVLDVEVGDTLMLEIREGRQQTVMTQVAGIAESLLGAPAYMDLDALGQQIGEPDRFSAAYISMRDGWQSKVYADLKDMPAVAGISCAARPRKPFNGSWTKERGLRASLWASWPSPLPSGLSTTWPAWCRTKAHAIWPA